MILYVNTTVSCYMYSNQYDINIDDIAKPETLWRAVIYQAFSDLVYMGNMRTEYLNARRDAIMWFNLNNEDFINVCIMASMDPEYVMRRVKHAITHQEEWRRGCDVNRGIAHQRELYGALDV